MDVHVCKACGKGAIISAIELRLPKDVVSVKVITDKKVLSLFLADAPPTDTCPNCGMPIKIEKPIGVESKKPTFEKPVGKKP